MSQTVATKKSDLITLARSTTGMVQAIGTTPTVINLKGIGIQAAHNYTEAGDTPGLQDTFLTLFADGSDVGYAVGATVGSVTGGVVVMAPGAGGSGYTSQPTIAFTASPMVGSVAITAGGSGYTSPPVVSFSGGGGSGALAVATVNPAGQVTGVVMACLGGGYTSAPTVAFTGIAGAGGGAAGTVSLAQPTATATISAGAIVALTVTGSGAGYVSNPTVTITGGGGSGATATATIVNNSPNLTTVGVGNGNVGGAPGICQRLPASYFVDAFARLNDDAWLGVVTTSGGTVRVFRTSY
jgi:hypothetical protein